MSYFIQRDFATDVLSSPRLGVGAELPEKQTQSGLSDMKLKNKMLGKKRERETTNSNDATPSAHEDGEEESKSRARVIHKKPRVDPFASTRKKGKGVNVPAMVSFNKLAGSPPAFETKSEKERVVATPHIDQNTPGPSSSTNASRTALTYEWVLALFSWSFRLTCNDIGQPMRLMSRKMKKGKGNPPLRK